MTTTVVAAILAGMSPIAAIVWQPYPADVPMADRTRCEVGCGRPGEMLRIDPMGTSILMPRGGETHVFCREHAGPSGLDEWLASAAPERLGFFDRLILRLSGRSDLITEQADLSEREPPPTG